jgi:hypothetical protein
MEAKQKFWQAGAQPLISRGQQPMGRFGISRWLGRL